MGVNDSCYLFVATRKINSTYIFLLSELTSLLLMLWLRDDCCGMHSPLSTFAWDTIVYASIKTSFWRYRVSWNYQLTKVQVEEEFGKLIFVWIWYHRECIVMTVSMFSLKTVIMITKCDENATWCHFSVPRDKVGNVSLRNHWIDKTGWKFIFIKFPLWERSF